MNIFIFFFFFSGKITFTERDCPAHKQHGHCAQNRSRTYHRCPMAFGYIKVHKTHWKSYRFVMPLFLTKYKIWRLVTSNYMY